MKAEFLSWAYRFFRSRMVKKVFAEQDGDGRARDFEEVVKLGHKWMKRLPPLFTRFSIPNGIESRLYDLKFDSPLTVSSFESDPDVLQVYLDLGVGGVCLKTVMREAREGNVRPRMQQVFVDGKECLVNAMGLPGKGIEAFIEAFKYSGVWARPVGFSVGGSDLGEYFDSFLDLNSSSFHLNRPHYFEVNVSCPNTAEGQDLMKNPGLLKELLDFMSLLTDVPVGVKLSPDLSNDRVAEFVKLVASYDSGFVNLGNTSARKCSDVGLPDDSISVGRGGLSGPAIYPRTLELVKVAKCASERVPVISTGGIYCAEQVAELRRAGACLVGVATSIGQDMYRIPKINYGLERIMRHGL